MQRVAEGTVEIVQRVTRWPLLSGEATRAATAITARVKLRGSRCLAPEFRY